MKHYLYKKQATEKQPCDLDIKVFYPNPFKAFIKGEGAEAKTYLLRCLFWLITLGKAKILYCTADDGRVIHTSYMIPKCLKFPFLKKGDWEIGPCFTSPESRGQGIYPKVLKYACSTEQGATYYIAVGEENVSSARGIEKAGFERCGSIRATRFLKRYKWEGR